MEMRLLTLLRGLQAWLYAFFFTPALALAQMYGDAGPYYGRGWGFWNGFWTIATLVGVLALIAWAVSRRGGRRRVGP